MLARKLITLPFVSHSHSVFKFVLQPRDSLSCMSSSYDASGPCAFPANTQYITNKLQFDII